LIFDKKIETLTSLRSLKELVFKRSLKMKIKKEEKAVLRREDHNTTDQVKNNEIISPEKKMMDIEEAMESGRTLIRFAHADCDEDNEIYYEATKPFRKKLPADFRRKNILLPEDFLFAWEEITNIIKELKAGTDLESSNYIKSYLNYFNAYKFHKWTINEKGNITKKYKKYLPWQYVVAYHLLNFMKLDNYYKYIHLCSDCRSYYIARKKRYLDKKLNSWQKHFV
jgi:hypothetical protein